MKNFFMKVGIVVTVLFILWVAAQMPTLTGSTQIANNFNGKIIDIPSYIEKIPDILTYLEGEIEQIITEFLRLFGL